MYHHYIDLTMLPFQLIVEDFSYNKGYYLDVVQQFRIRRRRSTLKPSLMENLVVMLIDLLIN